MINALLCCYSDDFQPDLEVYTNLFSNTKYQRKGALQQKIQG
jgi:hypothetical protein